MLRRRLDRAAPGYAEADFLKRRACEDVVERLSELMRPFPLAVDLGARTGVFGDVLAGSPAQDLIGRLIEAEGSARMLGGRSGPRVVLDEERLPLRAGSVDLIVSTLALHNANDLIGALAQSRRALKPSGLFLGALLGGATLFELRRSLILAEEVVRGGAGLRVGPSVDPKDAPALLQRAGYRDVSVLVDAVTVRYRSVRSLMTDLRRMSETVILVDRTRRPLTRSLLAETEAVYGREFGDGERLPATFEILLLTGWAPPAV